MTDISPERRRFGLAKDAHAKAEAASRAAFVLLDYARVDLATAGEFCGVCEVCACDVFVGDMGYADADNEIVSCEAHAPTVGETLREIEEEPEAWSHFDPAELAKLKEKLRARGADEKHVWPL